MATLYSRRTRFDDNTPRRVYVENAIADWFDYEDEYMEDYDYDGDYDCYDV